MLNAHAATDTRISGRHQQKLEEEGLRGPINVRQRAHHSFFQEHIYPSSFVVLVKDMRQTSLSARIMAGPKHSVQYSITVPEYEWSSGLRRDK